MFLLSSITSDGQRGWLLCLGERSQNSWLYQPPWTINLHAELSEPHTHAVLQGKFEYGGSTHLVDSYALDLDLLGPQLSGTLTIRSNSQDSDVKSYVVRGLKLSPPVNQTASFPPGRYSSLKYLKESGDSVGVELILILSAQQRVGLIKFNESYWGEPEFAPLALSNIRVISERKLAFQLVLEDGGIGRYLAVLKRNRLVLQRQGMPASPSNVAPITLARQDTLFPHQDELRSGVRFNDRVLKENHKDHIHVRFEHPKGQG